MTDDYIQTYDEEGRLKSKLTKKPSFAGGVGQWTTDEDGNLVPEDDQPVSVDVSRTDSRTITLDVPTDYATVGECCAEIADLRPAPGLQIKVNVESGHTWQDTVELENQDLRHVTITSEDSVVNADGDHPGGNGLVLVNCAGPRWDLMLDGQSTIHRGIVPRQTSTLVVTSGNGARNCNRGLEVTRGAVVYAEGCDFSGNSDRGISATRNAIVFASNADLSDNGDRAVRSGGSAYVNVVEADLTNAGDRACFASNGSLVNMMLADTSGSAVAFEAQDSIIYADGLTADNLTGSVGGLAGSAARVDAQNLTMNNPAGQGVRIENGSVVNLDGATIDGAGNQGIVCNWACLLNLSNVTITDGSDTGVWLRFGSTAQISGEVSGNTSDLVVGHGSTAAMQASTTNSTGGNPHEDDLNISPNTVTGSGIIFAESTETA